MFGTMRVEARMAWGFGAVMILLLLVSAVSLARLRKMNDEVQSIIDNRHPKIMLANEAIKLTIDNGRQLRSMLLIGNQQERDQYRAIVEQNRPRIHTILTQVASLLQSDQGRRLLHEVSSREQVLDQKYGQLYQLLEAGSSDAAAFITTDFYTANNAFWAALDALAQYQAAQLLAEGRSTNTVFHQTRTLILALTLAAVAIGVLIASWITTSVARRLKQDRQQQESRTAQLSDRLAVSEAELHGSETALAMAADAASLGFWVRDLRHGNFWASSHWRSLFGFGNTEAIDVDSLLQRVPMDDRSSVARCFGLAHETHREHGGSETIFRIDAGDGAVRWVASHGRVECDSDGAPLAIRGVSLDITAQKQAELDIAQKRKEVTYLARIAMLGELSGAMAHELNQPLTAILLNAGAAQMFLMQRADPELDVLRDIMQDIIDEDRRAGDIIKRLRGLFGKGEIVRQALAVNDLVCDVARVLRNDLINHSVTMRTELAHALPMVLADRVQLQQVLINLVLNACDAMDGVAAAERIVTVRTACLEAGVLVTVADCGTGIESADRDIIFESFYTTKERGMGLGLSICRNIVGANGGRLWAENHAGPGASFHFSLPGHAR